MAWGAMRAEVLVTIAFMATSWAFAPAMRRPRLMRRPVAMVQNFPDSYRARIGAGDRQAGQHFEDLAHVAERLRVLSEREVEYLSGFWDPALHCFSIVPNAERFSVASTCAALEAVLENPKDWKGFAGVSDEMINLDRVGDEMLDADWTLDEFQTPFLLHTLSRLKRADVRRPKVKRALEALLSRPAFTYRLDRPPSRSSEAALSPYLSYWNVHTLLRLLRQQLHPAEDLTGNPSELSSFYNRVTDYVEQAGRAAAQQVYRQLALHSAGDFGEFDAITLAYSLLAYAEISYDTYSRTFTDSAPVQANRAIIAKAIEIVFSHQRADGLWRKGAPAYQSRSRDLGNSYVWSFDMLGSILEVFKGDVELLRPYMPHMSRSLEWAEENVVSSLMAEFCDVDSMQTYGKRLSGWRSNHLEQEDGGKPLAWCTAHVFVSVSRFSDLTSLLLKSLVLDEFGGQRIESATKVPWLKLMDTDLDVGVPTSLKTVLEKHMLGPLAASDSVQGDPLFGLGGAPPGLPSSPMSVKYSAILFGPPGTAKTTICQSIAYYLGWDFVTISTSDFLSSGLTHIASQLQYTFSRLKALERTVILFDEIEEFCMDREAPGVTMESRMLTTAMLTQLNDLRRQRKSIFFIATNRIASFDPAISRPGRIDLILFVGTPNLASRLARLEKSLLVAFPKEHCAEKALSVARPFMEEHWEEELQFFNFMENEMFMEQTVAAAKAFDGLSTAKLTGILSMLTKTTTIKGEARLDYVRSVAYSRAS